MPTPTPKPPKNDKGLDKDKPGTPSQKKPKKYLPPVGKPGMKGKPSAPVIKGRVLKKYSRAKGSK
jgi:hypothetical protein